VSNGTGGQLINDNGYQSNMSIRGKLLFTPADQSTAPPESTTMVSNYFRERKKKK
jgi:hypothetical protein